MSQPQSPSASTEATPLRLTPRGKAVITLILLYAVVSALAYSVEGLAAALSSVLLVVALLAYWRLVGVARASAAASLVVERRVEGALVEGRRVKVRIEVRNSKPVLLEHVEVYDSPPRLWDTEGQPSTVITLPPYSEKVLEYSVIPVYGRHEFGDIRVVAYDPLGLFCFEVTVPASMTVYVQPKMLGRVAGIYLVPSTPRPGGTAPGRRKGLGTIFYDVREYVPGDDTRLIDWKSWARTGRLMVKEFEQEVQIYTMLVFDVTPTMFIGSRGQTKLENTARIIRTLLDYIAWRGDVYRLAVVDPTARLYATPWLRGRASLPLAARILSSIEWPEGAVNPEQLDATAFAPKRVKVLREELPKLLPREKTIVLLFTDVGGQPAVAERYANILNRLRVLRHEVLAVIPMTEAFEERVLEERDKLAATLYRVLVYKRLEAYNEIKRAFRRIGVPVVITGPVDVVQEVMDRLEAYRRVLA